MISNLASLLITFVYLDFFSKVYYVSLFQISILTDNLGNQIPAVANNRNSINNNINSPPSPKSQHLHFNHSQYQNNPASPNQAQIPQSTAITQAKDPNNRRKDTIGANGLRLFEKLTSVIYTDGKNTNCLGGLVGGKKREVTSATLYNLLAACLDSMPDCEYFQCFEVNFLCVIHEVIICNIWS